MKTRVIQDEPEGDYPVRFVSLPQLPEDQRDRSAEVIS